MKSIRMILHQWLLSVFIIKDDRTIILKRKIGCLKSGLLRCGSMSLKYDLLQELCKGS